MMTIKVTGDADVVGKFNNASRAVQGGAIMVALLSAGQLVVNAAQDNLKKLGAWITGNLARSLTVQPAGTNAVRIGTNVVYGPRIEYGFAGADSLGRIYNQAPRPYLRPALEENKDAILREISDTLRALIGGM